MLQVIFFDLGSTLIHAKVTWAGADFWRRGDAALVQVLRDAGFPLSGETFVEEYGSFLDRYYADRAPDDSTERTAFSALQEMLAQKGYANIPAPLLRTALDAMYAITQTNWYAEDDAIPTLETLKARGYRLGLISNTSDDQNVQQLVDQWSFRPFFEFIITSAGYGIRKPDARIFQFALDHFGIQPAEAVMIGDTLEADILGANQLGIYSIWITRRAVMPPDGELPIQPQAIVSALGEIPELLKNLANCS